MPITTTQPATLQHTEIPFDRVGISLSVSPRITPDGRDLTGSAVFVGRKYRKLPDGQIEFAPDKDNIIVNVGDITADAPGDPVLAVAMAEVFAALQTYIAAKAL
jgi:hypothetical protein